MSLISVEEARNIILEQSPSLGVEEVDFLNCEGRVLREPVRADRDFPPFDRVSMDGIAIHTDAFAAGRRSFPIEGVQAAGSPQCTLGNPDNCLEAMTGAILPKGTNAVIPYEKLTIENGKATLKVTEVEVFQNVHKKGLDRKKGEVIISENTKISPAEIGVLATVGKTRVLVSQQPRVIVISTGNELVAVEEQPQAYQIRRSNVHTLQALLRPLDIHADIAHIPDDKEQLRMAISGFLQRYDVLMFSGAVSKGKFDYIPEILEVLGVEKLFHRVRQRPGKPFWFGRKGDTTVFAFPGNPVSTFVSCLKYFFPWYQRLAGVSLEEEYASLGEEVQFRPGMTYFLPVKLSTANGRLEALPVRGKGSGDLANLVEADAFMELPEDRTVFHQGESYPILPYRRP